VPQLAIEFQGACGKFSTLGIPNSQGVDIIVIESG
jgi:hypothetical protein